MNMSIIPILSSYRSVGSLGQALERGLRLVRRLGFRGALGQFLQHLARLLCPGRLQYFHGAQRLSALRWRVTPPIRLAFHEGFESPASFGRRAASKRLLTEL